jgi:predicted ATP-binding protein involved in virulence
MKIKRMLVERLNQRIDADVKFDESLNIITGSNGSGKTTFLKATWYLFSGNLTKALQEIYFKRLLLETDSLTIELLCDDPDIDNPVFTVNTEFHAPRFNAAAQWPEFQSNLTGTLDQIRERLWQFNAALAINHDSLFFRHLGGSKADFC